MAESIAIRELKHFYGFLSQSVLCSENAEMTT